MDRITLSGGGRLHFGGLRSSSLFFADDVALLTSLDSSQSSVKWWEGESAPPSLTPWSLAAKKWSAFCESGSKWEHSCSDLGTALVHRGKERAEHKSKALDLPVELRPYHHEFWVVTKSMRL